MDEAMRRLICIFHFLDTRHDTPPVADEDERGRCTTKGARLMAWCESQMFPRLFLEPDGGDEWDFAWWVEIRT